MPVTTRHQVGNGNHTSFVFQQLETPPKRSRKQLCDHNLESVQTQTVNVRHNPLYSFENPFGTPSKTSNDTSNIVNMVHPNEIKRRLGEQARETQRTLDAIYATERENQHVGTSNQAHYERHNENCPHNPFGNNDGNHSPPRTPRATMGACPSPPKSSHHDTDEEITSEDVVRFQQDGFTQKLMLRALEENGDQ